MVSFLSTIQYIALFADVDASSNEENLTTMHNNAVDVDIPVKAVVNITLTGCVRASLVNSAVRGTVLSTMDGP